MHYQQLYVLHRTILSVTAKKQTAFRLSEDQHRKLERLSKKLGLTKSNVVRLAITRLAEAEKIH